MNRLQIRNRLAKLIAQSSDFNFLKDSKVRVRSDNNYYCLYLYAHTVKDHWYDGDLDQCVEKSIKSIRIIQDIIIKNRVGYNSEEDCLRLEARQPSIQGYPAINLEEVGFLGSEKVFKFKVMSGGPYSQAIVYIYKGEKL